MTWKEFKDLVDVELAKQGGGDYTEVGYIDTKHYPEPDDLEINIGASGLSVWS